MDFLLLDRTVWGEDAEELFSEAPVLLDGCFMPRDDSVVPEVGKTRADYGLPVDKSIVCLFNKTAKFSRKMMSLYAMVAIETQCVLWFLRRGQTQTA